MNGWHIYALACMINAPTDCFEQNLPKVYPLKIECKNILIDRYRHLDEIPMKVEGSKWIKVECVKTN